VTVTLTVGPVAVRQLHTVAPSGATPEQEPASVVPPLVDPPPVELPPPETRLQPGWLVQLLADSSPQGVMVPVQLVGAAESQLHPWRIWHWDADVSDVQVGGVPVHGVDELKEHP
jgi:hypothetical protein